MKKTTQAFLNLFFNKNEEICFSQNKYAYPSKKQEEINEDSTVLVAINPITGQRKDENVTNYRTFLIECDDMPLDDQIRYIKEKEFPFSYCCFSGGKSYHFALVLDRDLPSLHIYKHIYEWILNIMDKADQKTKNPSRSVRFPGVIRPDTGKEQKLMYIGKRISQQTLDKWLNKYEEKKPKVSNYKNPGRYSEPDIEGISNWAIRTLTEGVHNLEGSRNQKWMSIGCELALNGFDLDRTLEYLYPFFSEQSDFLEKEWKTAVTSGWNYAEKIVTERQ